METLDDLFKAAAGQLPQVNFDHAVEAVEDATSAASGPASGSLDVVELYSVRGR